ncbi:3-oxoacyl-[acyl-carrier-protein] reductase FabG [Nymphon striatum]|nr:3-oxoacyl-[acyl-carrier-protein] reductase FabG [Nymphon striatum]
MSKRDDLIKKYAADLSEKCGVSPDMDFLTKVTIGCGPSIYNADSSTVSGSDETELATVKNNFLIKKLGLSESQDLDGAIDSVMEKYGRSNRSKYRAVVYYLLAKHFGKESMMALDGKIAIVTGGAQGIGYAIVKRFLQDGAKVAIADIDKSKSKQAIKELSPLGDVSFIATDVGNRLDVHNMVASVVDQFGDIDILVNNAGISHSEKFLDISEDDFDRVMRVNLKGGFLCGQVVAKFMVDKIKQGGAAGSIVNMSSINGTLAISDQVPYSVSKGALNQLTKVMALSLAEYGIRVNGVGPGSIMTAMLTQVNNNADARDRILSRTPLGRIGQASEIAAIVAFLASDEASYMTGETIHADGGRMALNYSVPVPELEIEQDGDAIDSVN